MTEFCTYLYKDPKANVSPYVGKGVSARPARHFHPRTDTQLSRMLKKRVREGFSISPVILAAASDDDACEMEMLLIELIGREDLGKGTLFNKTNGGEGAAGRIVTSEEKTKRVATFANKSAEELADINKRIQDKRLKTMSERGMWEQFSKNMSIYQSRKCTVDGTTIYNSRKELIEALGQSKKTGSRSPNFRYV